jgi:gamma-glutamylcyclotransferase (GGCT)/AIG2-like uncharacterized protein YtfP
MTTVAVYGSLRKGFGNHRLVEDSTYLGTDYTYPEFTMYSMGGFPYVMHEGNTSMVVELYDVDDNVMARLDRLEGYPTFYDRKQIPTSQGDAWIYFMHTAYRGTEEVESGDWGKYKAA